MASIPFYEWFNNVLLTSANSVPIQSLWTCLFANPVDLNRAIQAGLYENHPGGFYAGYYTLAPGAAINTAQGANGALFANSVTIPGDGMGASKYGPEGSGMIKGNISSGRNEMENLSISFLDTNMSFVDYNLRPWAIYASHKSLKNPNVKSTIIIIQWSKTGAGNPLLPRAIWTFFNSCPVNIKSEDWNYGPDNVIKRQVEFAYDYYLLNADPAFITAQNVSSIISKTLSTQKYQPVEVPRSGISSHSGNQQVNINSFDTTDAGRHAEAQPVIIPTDDMVSRGINIGLEILNGNSNVQIESNDVVDRLRSQGEELLRTVTIPENDTPSHINGDQIGYVYKRPTGPDPESGDAVREPAGVVSRPDLSKDKGSSVGAGFEKRSPKIDKSPTELPKPKNSKTSSKDNSDTPLFFPGDGDENTEKIGGRTVSGELDTVEMVTLSHQSVTIEKTGDVGKNIPLQIITISKDDMVNGKHKSHQEVIVDKNDVSGGKNIQSQQVTVERNDNIKSHSQPKLVVVNSDDRR